MMRAILVLCWLLAVSPVWAADYYVSTTGNNANSCAQAQNISTPKQTINNLRDNCSLTGGDTVFIRGGLYTEGLNWIGGPSGTSWASPLTFTSYMGEAVTIRPNAGTDRALTLINSGTGVDDGSQYLVFNGLTFDGRNATYDVVKIAEWDGLGFAAGGFPSRHIRFTNFRFTSVIQDVHPQQGALIGGPDVQLIDGEIDTLGGPPGSGSNSQGIYGAGSDLLVDGVHIHHINGWCMSNIDSASGVDSVNHIIINNRVHDCAFGGINEGEGTGHVIANNIVYDNVGQGIYINAFGAGTSTGIKVLNNTVVNNGTVGISVGILSQNTNTVVRNNISWGNGGADWENDEGTTIVNSNLFGNVNVSGNLFNVNPLFVNVAGEDFHLQDTSPAINAGATLMEVTDDLDGTARPQGAAYDIGAYESGGGGDGGGGETDPPSEPPAVDVRGRIRAR